MADRGEELKEAFVDKAQEVKQMAQEAMSGDGLLNTSLLLHGLVMLAQAGTSSRAWGPRYARDFVP